MILLMLIMFPVFLFSEGRESMGFVMHFIISYITSYDTTMIGFIGFYKYIRS